jgi:rhodanese-related sulfurtransferase
MSTTAAKDLAALGYTNIAELDGSMRAWAAAGHEITTD